MSASVTEMVDPASTSHLGAAWYYLTELVQGWQFKGALAAVSAFFGTEPVLFGWLIGLLALDLAFGLAESIKRKRFSCRKLGRGVLKIPCYCLYIILVGAVDSTVSTSLGWDTPLLELFVSYLVATDAISCMTHMVRLGLPVPERLRRLIVYARCRVDHEIDEMCETPAQAEQPAPKRRGRRNAAD